MLEMSWYLLKVLIVSGILCGYYFIALKDKVFHKWNRFYLLFTVILSLVLPFISIDIIQSPGDQGTAIKVLQAVSVQDEMIVEMGRDNSFLTANNLVMAGYIFISLILIGVLLRTLLKIYRIKRNYPNTEVKGINFINTNAKGTPFSFFNSIFWNRAIDLHTKHGQQIFNHEVAHIKERHTHDKVFMNVVLLFFWINPFFWIIRKELNMIHEFVADKMAVEDGDINAFAEMILSSVYPGEKFSLTNNFFYSPLKRRLMMLTKNKNSQVNYASRLLVLPLAAIIFFAFSLKMKKPEVGPIYNGKQITVIVDAGHGGADYGAQEGDFHEKEITLAIAKKIQSMNGNKNIRILLSRNNDNEMPVKDRVQFALNNSADLFISVHLNSTQKEPGSNESTRSMGLEVIIPKNENNYLLKSKLLGSAVIESFKKDYLLPTQSELKQSQMNIYVLKENKYPAIIIQPANLTAEKDLDYITKPENQETVAKNILKGIENYAQNNFISGETNKSIVPDTLPKMSYKVKMVTCTTTKEASDTVEVKYVDGSTEIITKKEAKERGFVLPPPPPAPPRPVKAPKPPAPPVPPTPVAPSGIKDLPLNALYILDGKETDKKTIEQMQGSDIAAINVLKSENAIAIYGEKGRNGVIELTTKEAGHKQKKYNYSGDSSLNLKLREGSAKPLIYVDGKISNNAEKIAPADIVSINVFKGDEAIRKYGPAGVNGVVEISTINNDAAVALKNFYRIFNEVEQPAQFPGGPAKWATYIQKNIAEKISDFGNDDYGTCIVKFIVDENGNVSDLKATTMEGTHLAQVAVEAIRKGPKWIPAKQNGHTVVAYTLQPVTLTNPGK